MASLDNWLWLKKLIETTHNERKFRFPTRPVHKSYSLVMNMPVPKFLPSNGTTPFAQAMPDEFKDEDPVKAYRQYYNAKKRHLFSWTNREVPSWIENPSI